MFRNSGKKIMGFVNFMFYLNLVLAILAVIVAAVFVYLETNAIKWVVVSVLGGAVVAALYMLIVFLSFLCLYAFGELVHSSAESRRILGEMQRDAERYSPQNYRDPIQVTSVTRSKPSIAERKAPAPTPVPVPAAPTAPAPKPVEVQPVEVTQTIGTPAPEEPARSSFSFDYKAAAGAPGFGGPDHAPRPLFCTKCGAKHEPGTANCRYCGTPLA